MSDIRLERVLDTRASQLSYDDDWYHHLLAPTVSQVGYMHNFDLQDSPMM